jgi:Glycosyl transferases group 1
LRILMIGSDNPWRMEAAVERAFRRAGHETLLIDDRRIKRLVGRRLTQRWARRHANSFRPDFVFLSKCLALDPETVDGITRDVPNAMWYHDPQWHADLDHPDIAHIATIGRLARSFFVTGFETEWRAHGLPAKFLPAAGDAGIRPVAFDQRFSADVTFVGTGYDPQRARYLVAIAEHIDLKVWGRGWRPWRDKLSWGGRQVEGAEFAAVCSSSKIVLGIDPERAWGGSGYTSDRTWMVMLAGGFLLGQYSPGLAEMLREGVHCAWYDDVESCINRCFHFAANAVERQTIRAQGEAFVRANHTYDQRIAYLLEDREWVNPLPSE